MKSMVIAVTFVCSLMGLSSQAFATTAQAPIQHVPNGAATVTSALTFYGSNHYYIESSTAANQAVLLASGSGFLYGVECSSGSLGDFANFFDSASASGITNATQGEELTPAVFSAVYASSSSASTYFGTLAFGKYEPTSGSKRFVNGIVGIKSGSGNANCVVNALLDSTVQANPQTH